jgi:O-antigen/teichoic acid export membrane protein
MSRTKRSVLGVVGNLTYSGVTIVSSLVATPLLIRWLGVERFGAARVLTDWMGYLALFDLGITGALMPHLAQKVNQRDETGVNALLMTGMRAYAAVLLLASAAGGLLVLLLPFLISLQRLSASELRIAGCVWLLTVTLLPLNVFRALGEARQRGYLILFALTIQSVLTTSLSLVTAYLGWGLVGQAAAVVAGIALFTIYIVIDNLRAYPRAFRACANDEARRAIRSLHRPSLIFNLSSRIGLLSDNIIIAFVLNPTAVVPFFLTQRLASIALAQLQGIGNATWAGLTELYVHGKTEKMQQRFLELTSLTSALGIVLLTPIAAFNHNFILRWVGADAYAGDAVTFIVCLNVWLWSIFSLWGWLISGTGHIAEWLPSTLAVMGLNLLVSVAATFAFGFIGPLLGTLAGFTLVYVWAMPRLLKKLFGFAPRALWRHALAPLVWGAPYALICCVSARFYPPHSWFSMISAMSLTGLGGMLIWWILGLNKAMREEWRQRGAHLLAPLFAFVKQRSSNEAH